MNQFLKEPDKKGIGKEVRFMQMNLKDFPDPEFWLNLNLGFKLNSVLYFRKKDVKEGLKVKYAAWQNERENYMSDYMDTFFKHDCDERPEVEKKPRSNKDFLS